MKKGHFLWIVTAALMVTTSNAVNAAEVANDYGYKVVYNSTDGGKDIPTMKQDCQRRGGTFYECGSQCENKPEPPPCPQICSYTCEMPQ